MNSNNGASVLKQEPLAFIVETQAKYAALPLAYEVEIAAMKQALAADEVLKRKWLARQTKPELPLQAAE